MEPLPGFWPALPASCALLDFCVLALYACIGCNTCGFGKRALLSDSPFRSSCCSFLFLVTPRQPDNKTSRRTNMPLVGKPQRACSCVMLICGAYHICGQLSRRAGFLQECISESEDDLQLVRVSGFEQRFNFSTPEGGFCSFCYCGTVCHFMSLLSNMQSGLPALSWNISIADRGTTLARPLCGGSVPAGRR